MDWQLAEAKNRFSELFSLVIGRQPQRVRRRNDAVIILDEKEYERLKGKRRTFKEFLLDGPDLGDINISRDKSPVRDVSL
ncbi:MAG: type II toxin-antitoxin system Phd/YefM family antitoxin [Bdellovibrionales bacterium]